MLDLFDRGTIIRAGTRLGNPPGRTAAETASPDIKGFATRIAIGHLVVILLFSQGENGERLEPVNLRAAMKAFITLGHRHDLSIATRLPRASYAENILQKSAARILIRLEEESMSV